MHFWGKLPEAISKTWIRLEGKARCSEKAEHTRVCEHFELARNAAIEL
jgi:hypothetical protein